MTHHNITLSPLALGLANAMAAQRGVSTSAYIDSLILTIALPEITTNWGAERLAAILSDADAALLAEDDR